MSKFLASRGQHSHPHHQQQGKPCHMTCCFWFILGNLLFVIIISFCCYVLICTKVLQTCHGTKTDNHNGCFLLGYSVLLELSIFVSSGLVFQSTTFVLTFSNSANNVLSRKNSGQITFGFWVGAHICEILQQRFHESQTEKWHNILLGFLGERELLSEQ